MEMQAIKDHELYNICYQAHYATSFSPEKRAVSDLEYYEGQKQKLEEKGIDTEKFKQKFISWKRAQSRTMSSMITGPARFPVARNQKRMETERKRADEMSAYLEKCFAPPRQPRLTGNEEIERLEEKVLNLKKNHKSLLASPKDDPFRDCLLQNSRQNIKATEGRIELLKRQSVMVNSEYMMGDVQIVECPSENRIRLIFPGKPDRDTITKLKKCAFRWSPSNSAWQGYITQKYRLKEILG